MNSTRQKFNLLLLILLCTSVDLSGMESGKIKTSLGELKGSLVILNGKLKDLHAKLSTLHAALIKTQLLRTMGAIFETEQQNQSNTALMRDFDSDIEALEKLPQAAQSKILSESNRFKPDFIFTKSHKHVYEAILKVMGNLDKDNLFKSLNLGYFEIICRYLDAIKTQLDGTNNPRLDLGLFEQVIKKLLELLAKLDDGQIIEILNDKNFKAYGTEKCFEQTWSKFLALITGIRLKKVIGTDLFAVNPQLEPQPKPIEPQPKPQGFQSSIVKLSESLKEVLTEEAKFNILIDQSNGLDVLNAAILDIDQYKEFQEPIDNTIHVLRTLTPEHQSEILSKIEFANKHIDIKVFTLQHIHVCDIILDAMGNLNNENLFKSLNPNKIQASQLIIEYFVPQSNKELFEPVIKKLLALLKRLEEEQIKSILAYLFKWLDRDDYPKLS